MAIEGEGILQLPRRWKGEVGVMPDRRAEGAEAWAVSGEGAWRPGEGDKGNKHSEDYEPFSLSSPHLPRRQALSAYPRGKTASFSGKEMIWRDLAWLMWVSAPKNKVLLASRCTPKLLPSPLTRARLPALVSLPVPSFLSVIRKTTLRS